MRLPFFLGILQFAIEKANIGPVEQNSGSGRCPTSKKPISVQKKWVAFWVWERGGGKGEPGVGVKEGEDVDAKYN